VTDNLVPGMLLPLAEATQIDPGSTAWMLTSSAMVLLMLPGLALFYGGMVRQKNIVTTMMQSFVALGVIGVQWVLVGYALTFGESQGGLIGWSSKYFGLHGLSHLDLYADKAIPELVFVMFQGKFAIITPALISGAVAERMKFSTYVLFILLWSTLIYDPLAHWVWAPEGWLFKMGVLDFAGGTVVHISAGFGALALALVLGPRRGYPKEPILPHNLPLVLTGAGLLWFGWFGFNAGSAVAAEHPVAGYVAGLAFTTTQVAAASAALVWMLVEWLHYGKPTGVGMASGIVAGLVAITPGAGHVDPLSAIAMGGVASLICYGAVRMKGKLGYDDSLDAFGVHGMGGLWGAIATGIFCTIPVAGALHGGMSQLGKQCIGALAAVAFSFVGTLIIALALKATLGLRSSEAHELEGLDITVHGERAYHLDL
jgi:Amt family ammonium transporter